jgi:hypothetical protein
MTSRSYSIARSFQIGLLLTGAVLSSPALMVSDLSAQEPADTAGITDRPFVEGGIYDKPYLTTLLGRTAIGGYAEAHSRWEQSDGVREELGFQLKRWNLFTSTRVSDVVSIAAELEIEELGEEIILEFAAIDFALHPSLTLRAGAILSPVGRFNLAHDSPRNDFTDRPLVSTDLVGTALTEPGFGLLGSLPVGGVGRFTYEVYAVNGFHEGLIYDSSEGTRIPLGKRNAEDNNASPAWVGRLAWSLRPGVEVGVSGHHGAYNVFHLDGEEVEARRTLTIGALDAEGEVLGIRLSGEAVVAHLDIPPGLDGVYAGRQRGLYVQGVREFGRGWVATLPASNFAIGTRFDVVDFDARLRGDSVKRWTLGVNFRPTADSVLKLDYLRGRDRDRFNNASEKAGVLLSLATYF